MNTRSGIPLSRPRSRRTSRISWRHDPEEAKAQASGFVSRGGEFFFQLVQQHKDLGEIFLQGLQRRRREIADGHSFEVLSDGHELLEQLLAGTRQTYRNGARIVLESAARYQLR